jgi:hypothetical protein
MSFNSGFTALTCKRAPFPLPPFLSPQSMASVSAAVASHKRRSHHGDITVNVRER